jgi:hypothetical protein
MAGQAEVVRTVATVVAICAGITSAYFLCVAALTFGQAQAATVTGRPGALSQAFEQLTPAVICLAVALNARTLADQVTVLLSGQAATDAGGVAAVWQAIATMVANTVVVSGGAWMAIGLATGALAGQVAMITGRPFALATVVERVIAVIATAVLTAMTAQIVNFVIHAVS